MNNEKTFDEIWKTYYKVILVNKIQLPLKKKTINISIIFKKI